MMETKKNKKYELEPKRPLFFGIGMIISLSLALVAFEWKSEIEPIITFENESFIDELIYMPPPTDITPPPPPPEAVEIVPVDDDEEIVEDLPPIDVATDEDENIDIIIPEDDFGDGEPVDEAPISWASEMPSFEGGMENFYKFLAKNIRYPNKAQQIGVEGRVFVQFVVEKDGSLSNLQVVKGIGAGCDEEALRVMEEVPKFIPGKQGDVRVRVRMIVPINFQLQ